MATVAFNFACDMAYGFIQDPNEHQRVGYVTAFAGLGLSQALNPDLTVTNPQSGAKMAVVGVMGQFEWTGGDADPLQISMYVSQENAAQLKMLQESTLTSTKVNVLNYLIVNYDLEVKQWFTQAAPQQPPLSGMVPGGKNLELNVNLTPVAVAEGIDVNFYQVSVQIAPAGNQAYVLTFANSATAPVAKAWGLVIGSPATA
jgi:hypothetical protein